MARSPAPTFGKRNRPVPATGGVGAPVRPAEADPHRAFFAAVRAQTGAGDPELPAKEVPRSLRAAFLAGTVVACGLAGLDATEKVAALRAIPDVLPGRPAAQLLVPALILLAVVGGGRSAATSLLVAHALLHRVRWTSHLAYALCGAAAAAVLAAALMLVLGQAPAHGLAIDVLAGAAGGFFYRVFAGTRRADPGAAS